MQKTDNDIVTLSHGGGGTRTASLIKDIILRWLGNPILDKLDDAAVVDLPSGPIAVSTDSYVVSPLFFPGGDIGRLSACGTINDLAMQGAKPLYLTLGLILEEGLALSDLDKIVQSIAEVVRENDVRVITGDTKVVERGKGNGVFINTTGIGARIAGVDVGVANARPGDVVILTGSIGDHGIAVLSSRQGFSFDSNLLSDVAALWNLIRKLLAEVPAIHCLRDPTRGGVAAALCDIAQRSSVCVRINESALVVRPEVRGACGLLGFDPLTIANEGKAVIVCQKEQSAKALAALKNHPLGRDSAIIGEVTVAPAGAVLLKTKTGGERIVDMPLGEDLPRIC